MEYEEEKPLTAKTKTDKQVDYNAVFGVTNPGKNKIASSTLIGKINHVK